MGLLLLHHRPVWLGLLVALVVLWCLLAGWWEDRDP